MSRRSRVRFAWRCRVWRRRQALIDQIVAAIRTMDGLLVMQDAVQENTR